MKFLSVLLVLVCAIASVAQTGTVKRTMVTLRGTPAEDGKVVENLTKGAEVKVFTKQGSWLLVQSSDFAGWLSTGDLDFDIASLAPARSIVTTSAAGETTTAPAKKSGDREYIKGPRGGCYYMNDSGKKTYVDHDKCN